MSVTNRTATCYDAQGKDTCGTGVSGERPYGQYTGRRSKRTNSTRMGLRDDQNPRCLGLKKSKELAGEKGGAGEERK